MRTTFSWRAAALLLLNVAAAAAADRATTSSISSGRPATGRPDDATTAGRCAAWYRPLVTNAEHMSIAFVLITLNMYAWVLNQRGTSNYVKHYLAFFAVLLSVRRARKSYCTADEPCNGRLTAIFGCSEVFALACTNYWQIVMCIEYLYFLRYIDKLNSFTANISVRNKVYHICCWLFSTLWTYFACTLESHQSVYPQTSDITYENDWLSTLRFNYKYLLFFYIPGLTNIVINVIILLLSVVVYKPKTKKDNFKTKGFEKLSIRKQLFVVLTLIWVVDVLAFIDQNNRERQWLQTADDVVKALNGTVTCFILVFKRHILTEVTNKFQMCWHHAPYLSRRGPNAICVSPVADTDSNDDRCIL